MPVYHIPSTAPGLITAEQQLDNLRAALAELRRARLHRGRIVAIRACQEQLRAAEDAYHRSLLRPIAADDGVPF